MGIEFAYDKKEECLKVNKESLSLFDEVLIKENDQDTIYEEFVDKIGAGGEIYPKLEEASSSSMEESRIDSSILEKSMFLWKTLPSTKNPSKR